MVDDRIVIILRPDPTRGQRLVVFGSWAFLGCAALGFGIWGGFTKSSERVGDYDGPYWWWVIVSFALAVLLLMLGAFGATRASDQRVVFDDGVITVHRRYGRPTQLAIEPTMWFVCSDHRVNGRTRRVRLMRSAGRPVFILEGADMDNVGRLADALNLALHRHI